jgi:hypothetical protein
MSRRKMGRGGLLHARVQASAQYYHQHPLLLPTPKQTIKVRLLSETTAVKRLRGRWPKLDFWTTENMVFLELYQVNWRAQGNNCVYYCMGRKEDELENPARSFRSHHEHAQSKPISRRCFTSLHVVVGHSNPHQRCQRTNNFTNSQIELSNVTNKQG